MLGASVTPKLFGMQVADDTMRQLGWPDGFVLMIGIIELVCVLLYVFPKTSVLGAVLMMALLGGAMATQIRVGSPLFSHQLFTIYLGLFMWGGLWLRDPALQGDVSVADVIWRVDAASRLLPAILLSRLPHMLTTPTGSQNSACNSGSFSLTSQP